MQSCKLPNKSPHSYRFSPLHSCSSAGTRLNHPRGNYRLNCTQMKRHVYFSSGPSARKPTIKSWGATFSFRVSKKSFPIHTKSSRRYEIRLSKKHIWRRQTLIACTVQLNKCKNGVPGVNVLTHLAEIGHRADR